MTTFKDLKDYFEKLGKRVIIVSDAETVIHRRFKGEIIGAMTAGGVATAFDPIAKASGCLYIARGKTPEDKEVVDKKGYFSVKNDEGNYLLKRVFLSPEEEERYYFGFANQTMWPLCHVAFERPKFDDSWYQGFKEVNKKFAKNVKDEIGRNTFIWLNDYQLSLVPKYLDRPKDSVLALFWHIPWPTWEIFRILPQKKEILESLLECDYLAFHRGYQARNFIQTVRRELEARIDEEKNQISYKGKITTVGSHPMGIDTDSIKQLVALAPEENMLTKIVRNMFGMPKKEEHLDEIFQKYKVILGVDRMDYTKGLILRMLALEKFFDNNKKYIGKVIYLGIMAPSRQQIDSYKEVKEEMQKVSYRINKKFATKDWKPLYLVNDVISREDIVSFYRRASLCLVTPRDDGMNLVSKEYVMAAASTSNPGMLILSEFAGSAIDLTSALIINPYDFNGVADAIKKGLEMEKSERIKRMKSMAETLEEKNVYDWALNFVRSGISSKV